MVASLTPPPGDPAHNPGMCPDWESNSQPFGSQASAQSTEPHQPGLIFYYFSRIWFELISMSLSNHFSDEMIALFTEL